MAASAAAASTSRTGCGSSTTSWIRNGTNAASPPARSISSWETRCPVSNTWTTPPCTDRRRARLRGGLDRGARSVSGGLRGARADRRSIGRPRSRAHLLHDPPRDADRGPAGLARQASVRIGPSNGSRERSLDDVARGPDAARHGDGRRVVGIVDAAAGGHRQRRKVLSGGTRNARRSRGSTAASGAMTRHRSAISTRVTRSE